MSVVADTSGLVFCATQERWSVLAKLSGVVVTLIQSSVI